MLNTKDIENFLASHTYSLETKRTYKDVITRVLGNVKDEEDISPSEILQLIDANGWGNARRCLALAATQKYLSWKYGANHPALAAKIKRIKGKPQRALDESTALQLLASFNRYKDTGARDLAIAALTIDTGLRSSEICRLEIRYIDFERLTLQVMVKGGQWEVAVFTPETAAHIQHWLSFRKSDSGWTFVNTRTGEQLTPEGLGNIVKSWGQRIGIELSPHDLRRTFAVLATESGAPERVLMAGGRWRHSKMIIRYTETLRLDSMRKYLPMRKFS